MNIGCVSLSIHGRAYVASLCIFVGYTGITDQLRKFVPVVYFPLSLSPLATNRASCRCTTICQTVTSPRPRDYYDTLVFSA
jgi:hypothetical protein